MPTSRLPSTTGSAVTAFLVISSAAASTGTSGGTVNTSVVMMSLARMMSPAGHLPGQVHQAAGVAPLVVVPAEHLRQPPARLGQPRVEHTRRRVTDDVGRHQRRVGIADDAVH